ncbi:MAG: NADH-quinone oxidoreductase subunit J [Chitinophagaceae bacterium]|nr:NADH-quinone oxidoreductase subunit J [Chitinophagaceae bacterium]MCB0739458.1 NADH-quinone oxidoreductase subunit J [Chitinophagaceae bacterium]HQV06476.1 NADH-quinone oxidoreductase subunit J [Chitinophagaceae bacterium]
MSGSTIIFYLLAAASVVFALLSVTTRQLFRAAIYLLFTLICIAGIYFWLQYEFIAAVQIVVYVGGIVVLIIFSIFLTQQAGEKLAKQKTDRQLLAALAVFAGFIITVLQISRQTFFQTDKTPVPPTMENIGQQMLSVKEGGYALPFEVISILLLAALVGCIVIALKEKKTSTQSIKKEN